MNGSDPSLARAIRGPITLITLGVLFALDNFTGYHFSQTWPVLLIVFGLLSLMRPGRQTPTAPPPTAAPDSWTPPSTPTAPSYRGSQYPGTPPPPSGGTA
jgi:hypothetical protein